MSKFKVFSFIFIVSFNVFSMRIDKVRRLSSYPLVKKHKKFKKVPKSLTLSSDSLSESSSRSSSRSSSPVRSRVRALPSQKKKYKKKKSCGQYVGDDWDVLSSEEQKKIASDWDRLADFARCIDASHNVSKEDIDLIYLFLTKTLPSFHEKSRNDRIVSSVKIQMLEKLRNSLVSLDDFTNTVNKANSLNTSEKIGLVLEFVDSTWQKNKVEQALSHLGLSYLEIKKSMKNY